jgi:2-isopropylmalate synthase
MSISGWTRLFKDLMRNIEIYDTTLRDGAQGEDICFSVEDKLRLTERLDGFGVHYIEGGMPGSNPKDAEYFSKVSRLSLSNARVVAFGSTHNARKKAASDPGLIALAESKAGVITIFGKSWDFHVKEALKISNEANLEIIHNSIAFLKNHAEKVFFDAEHFFNGYRDNPEYALKTLLAAEQGGADCLILCDTNGGMLPDDIAAIIREVAPKLTRPFGIHAHNDSDCAVANSVTAVAYGASQVQGTINGVGERCGNANLVSIIPNIQLKLGYRCVTDDQLSRLRELSRYVNETANLRHFKRQPFVGDSSFAHKAGIHVSAIMRSPETYEHIRPELVGNSQRVLISDLAGKSNILRKAEEFNVRLDPGSPQLQKIINNLKDLEHQGFQFEGAEASFELLLKKALGLHRRFFDLIGFRVIVEKRNENEECLSEATIMVSVNEHIEHTAATGDGPVNALDNALRKALDKFYPELTDVSLQDYKVRVLTTGAGTSSKVRVLIESGDGHSEWSTVGVSENIIEASWQALVDSIEYKLLKEKG